jgi:hypothetical protein
LKASHVGSLFCFICWLNYHERYVLRLVDLRVNEARAGLFLPQSELGSFSARIIAPPIGLILSNLNRDFYC